MQFTAGVTSTRPGNDIPKDEIGRMLVRACLYPWSKGFDTRCSSRDEVNKAFLGWCTEKRYHGVRPHEAFREVLQGVSQKTRLTFEGQKIHVYDRPAPHAAAPPGVSQIEYMTLLESVPWEHRPQ